MTAVAELQHTLATSPISRTYWETKALKYGCLHERLQLIADQVVQIAPRAVLDLGCSTGQMGQAIEAALPDVQYYGCDLSQAAVAAINRPHVVQRDLNADGLPFPELRFDCLIASGICEYVADLPGFLRDVWGKLNIGGHLVVSYHNLSRVSNWLRRLAGRKPVRNATWQELVSLDEFERLLELSGFAVRRRLVTHGRIAPAGPLARSGVARNWRAVWSRSSLLRRLFAAQVIYVCQKGP